ncbi:MAG TPA: TetR/AcrR family transcriptional regulator [Actinomycetota bacterium]|nr:TetR/AcrR family transcriptional regulator [Actinomycetota bacterium]
MTSTRSYRMSTRAAATEATRERIVEAACDAFNNSWYDDVTIRGIAAAAGVALQTVVNHFATKEALFIAANERNVERIERTRWGAAPGDVSGAVSALVDDYERNGDATIRTLAVEEHVPVVGPSIEQGRQGHERWVQEMFPEAIDGLTGAERKRRVAQLVAVTDVYTWKLLRRDKRLSREQTITAMCELVLAMHPNKQGGS